MILGALRPIVRGRFSHSIGDDLIALTHPLRFNKRKTSIDVYEEQMADYLGKSFCISFGYARTAFWATLQSLPIPKGSKIILPSITIKAMLDVVLHLGHTPLFVDTDINTGSVDIQSLKALLVEKPKVILLTYLFGVVPDVEEITDILHKENIFVIEDFSQCLNGESNNQKIGTFGDVSILSTSAVKTLDTYGGGLFFTDNEELRKSVLKIRNQLSDLNVFQYYQRVLISLMKNIFSNRIVFPIVFPALLFAAFIKSERFLRFVGSRSKKPINVLPKGWFIKYSEWQAICGLKYLNRTRQIDSMRFNVAQRYAGTFSFIGSKISLNRKCTYWQCVVIAKDPTRLRIKLAKRGIDSAQTSLVLLSELSDYNLYSTNQNLGARTIFQNGVYIPLYHQLKEREIKRVIKLMSQIKGDEFRTSEWI